MKVIYRGKPHSLYELKSVAKKWGGRRTTREDLDDALHDVALHVLTTGNTDVTTVLPTAIKRYTQGYSANFASLDHLLERAGDIDELVDQRSPLEELQVRDLFEALLEALRGVPRWPDRRYAAWVYLWLRNGCGSKYQVGVELGLKAERSRRNFSSLAMDWWLQSATRAKILRNYED